MNKNLIIAGINEAKISTLENPIIGTVGLATCVGILLYSEEHKKAIVAHVSNNCGECVNDTLKLIEESKLDSSPLKYVIIPGYYKNGYGIEKILDGMYRSCPKYFEPYEVNLENVVGVSGCTHQFAFDASSGHFVTDKIFSNNENFNEEKPKVM